MLVNGLHCSSNHSGLANRYIRILYNGITGLTRGGMKIKLNSANAAPKPAHAHVVPINK
jgi:hypothetical protein